jgi:hypothetical protein
MRLVRVDPLHALGTCSNALIVVWQAAPTREVLDGVRLVTDRLLRRYPAGIGVIGVSGELPLPHACDRQRLGALLQERGDRLLGLASIIEGSEPTRSLMASINLVVKNPCPLRIFSNVDEGVAWLAPLLRQGQPPPSVALRHAVERLKRELLQKARFTN